MLRRWIGRVLCAAVVAAAAIELHHEAARASGAPTLLTRPVISGAARVRATLRVSTGTWTGHPTAYHFRWARCDLEVTTCRAISNATSATHRVTSADLGSRLRALVTAVNQTGAGRARSAPAPIVVVRSRPSPCSGVPVSAPSDVARVVASYPASTTFCFSPGRYAVTATIVPQAGDRLIGQPGTIFDAGIPVTGWHLLGGIWAAPAPRAAPTFDYGGGYGGSYQFPQAVFADDVFEDDRPLIKAGVAYQGNVIGTPPSSLSRGQYFYDYDRQLIEMAADPSGHAVELVGLPDGVIHSYNAGVTIRGLTVQGSLGDGIVTGSGSGWRVEGNDVRLNHSEGVRVTTGALVTGNFIHDNGTYGIAASGDAMRFTGNEVARNDTSLYRMGDGECSDAGGSKITLSSNVVMDRNWYYENHCIGLWFDIDNSGVSILYNHVDRNYENGIDYEISYDAQIRGNEVSGSPHWAILDSASPNVTITANVVTSEGDGGIIINQGPRTDWPSTYGPHDAVHIEVHANRIRMRSGRCGAQQYGVAGTPFDGMAFSSTNRFYDNRYVLQNMTGRWFEWASGPVTIAGWRSLGQDAGSTFSRG